MRLWTVCRCWCRRGCGGCAGGGGIFSWCLVPCNSLVIVFVIVVTLAAKRANPAFYPNCLPTCNLFISKWSSQKLYLCWQLFMNMYRQFFLTLLVIWNCTADRRGRPKRSSYMETWKKIKLLLGFIDANPVKDDTSVLFQQNTRAAVELLLEER